MNGEDKARCPWCEYETSTFAPVAEESSVRVDDHTVSVAARSFEATCPTHGKFIYQRFGHHSTYSRKELSDLFSKADRVRLRAVLSTEEWKHFDKTIRGRRMPQNDEVERWLALLGR